MTDLVLPFPQARHLVESHARTVSPRASEQLPLLEAAGRVLAQAITADRDLPPFPRATRDGYAVRAADLVRIPASLILAGEVRAGAFPDSCPLQPGTCIEIMTGAPLPPGADAVVMVEYTERQAESVIVNRTALPGENFVSRAAEARAGDELLASGTPLSPAAIAVAASTGHAQVTVFERPKVAILATGDELVDITSQPGPAQIRNSNSYSLAAQVAAAGGRPEILPVAADDENVLRRLIGQGLQADLLLLSGGVSMGRYDLVEQVLAQSGAEFLFTGVQIQPGSPVVFGRVPSTTRLFFGLPGNPVSTMVTFDLFVRPVIEALSGTTPRPLQFLGAELKSNIRTKPGLTRFLPSVLTGEFEHCQVETVRWQGSGDIAAAARANCYLVVPPDRDSISAGERVAVLLRDTSF